MDVYPPAPLHSSNRLDTHIATQGGVPGGVETTRGGWGRVCSAGVPLPHAVHQQNTGVRDGGPGEVYNTMVYNNAGRIGRRQEKEEFVRE